jgi:hypothetical protein
LRVQPGLDDAVRGFFSVDGGMDDNPRRMFYLYVIVVQTSELNDKIHIGLFTFQKIPHCFRRLPNPHCTFKIDMFARVLQPNTVLRTPSRILLAAMSIYVADRYHVQCSPPVVVPYVIGHRVRQEEPVSCCKMDCTDSRVSRRPHVSRCGGACRFGKDGLCPPPAWANRRSLSHQHVNCRFITVLTTRHAKRLPEPPPLSRGPGPSYTYGIMTRPNMLELQRFADIVAARTSCVSITSWHPIYHNRLPT